MDSPARFTLCTGAMAGALAVFHLHANDADALDRTLGRLGLGSVSEGSTALRDLLGVDRGVVMRVGAGAALLVAHGGVQVARSLRRALLDAGLFEESWRDGGEPAWARSLFPEAADEVEARALLALGSCASPLGVDLLLAQRERWASAGGMGSARSDPSLDRVRSRLLVPPIVAGVGGANIGKSTLLNTLARRHVALTGDEPGTTRDHVGVALDLDGLVVKYLDLPGLREGAEENERRAIEIELRAIARADLLLLFGDATRGPIEIDAPVDRLVVALRSDLGEAGFACDLRVCARTGEGIDDLARLIRRRLVPDSAIDDPTPWKFWGSRK